MEVNMFHRIVSYMLFVGLLIVGSSDVQGAARKRQPTTRSLARKTGIQVPLDPRAMVVGQAAAEDLVLGAHDGVTPRRRLTPRERAFLTELANRRRRQEDLSARRAQGYQRHRLTKKERPTAEMLLTFETGDIVAALRSAHTVGTFVSKAREIVTFIQKITTGHSGAVVARLLAVRDQFVEIIKALDAIPGIEPDNELEVYDDDGGGYDDGVHTEPTYKERLLECIHANRKVGYKLLVLSVLVGGTWGFAPLYLPLVLSSGAVGSVVSGVVAAATGRSVPEAMADGAMKGALVGVMPTGGCLATAGTCAVTSAAGSVTDEKDAKKVVQDAALGAVVGAGTYLAVDSLLGAKVPEKVMSRELMSYERPLETCPVQPTCPRVEAPFDPRMLHPRRLPESVVTSVSNGPRALVPVAHDPGMGTCAPRATMCSVPAYVGSKAVQVFVLPTTPADVVLDGLRQRVIELERIVDVQNVSIREAIKPVATKFYDGIKLTSLFDQLLGRDAAAHVHATRCGIDAASIEQLQQCVVNLERTIVDQGRLVEEALKPTARKFYDTIGLTRLVDYVFSRFTSSSSAATGCVATADLPACVVELERTVAARDALIAESLKPMARKFYDAIGLTKLVATVRG
jgi:hypothetical protein